MNRRVPGFNFNIEQSRQSMDKIDALLRAEHAQLWINRDARQSRPAAGREPLLHHPARRAGRGHIGQAIGRPARDAAPQLDRIRAALLAINSADDERNPPETGLMERELERVIGTKLVLIPPSADTRGHGTTGTAAFYNAPLQDLPNAVPRRAN